MPARLSRIPVARETMTRSLSHREKRRIGVWRASWCTDTTGRDSGTTGTAHCATQGARAPQQGVESGLGMSCDRRDSKQIHITALAGAATPIARSRRVVAKMGRAARSLVVVLLIAYFQAAWGIADLSAVRPTNLPTAGSDTALTILGAAFGFAEPVDFPLMIRIGGTACTSSTWTSDTSIVGIVGNRMVSSQQNIVVTALGSSKTFSRAFTFDSPTLTGLGQFNAPAPGGDLVTISGDNFGTHSNSHFKARVGGSACAYTKWDTPTTVVCKLPGGSHASADEASAGRSVVLTVGRHGSTSPSSRKIMTMSASFTYDLPKVTSAFDSANSAIQNGNGPALGGAAMSVSGALLTLHGTNFGTTDYSMRVRVGPTRVMGVNWKSDTEVVVLVPAGFGTNKDISVSAAGSTQTLSAQFDYDFPVVSHAQGKNGATTGGASLTLFGKNFGTQDYSAVAKVFAIPSLPSWPDRLVGRAHPAPGRLRWCRDRLEGHAAQSRGGSQTHLSSASSCPVSAPISTQACRTQCSERTRTHFRARSHTTALLCQTWLRETRWHKDPL